MSAIVIRQMSDNAEVNRIDVTGLGDRQVERVERGLGINFNFTDYYWGIEDV